LKKKILLVLAVFCVIAISQVHALGLGFQANFYLTDADGQSGQMNDKLQEEGMAASTEQYPVLGFSFLLSPSRQLNFAGSYYFSETTHIIGLTADFCPEAFNFRLVGSRMTLLSNPRAWSLRFGVGIGGYANFWLIDSDNNDKFNRMDFTGGLRIPVGLSLNLANGRFEVFGHVAPSIGVRVAEVSPFMDWFFPVAVGARIWL